MASRRHKSPESPRLGEPTTLVTGATKGEIPRPLKNSTQGTAAMKQLTIVVKPFRAEAVLKALSDLGVDACAVREAKGYSRQKGYLERYLGSEYSLAYLPKVEISVWVADEQAEIVAQTVAKVARTGRIGDGKVFIVPVAWPEPIDF